MKTESPLKQILKDKSGLFTLVKPGEIVEARLLEKNPRAVYFDVSPFGTGVVYGLELVNAQPILKGLNPGDTIAAKVASIENDDGYVELSLAEAGKQKAWDSVKDIQEKSEVLTVKITGANAGGLMAQVSDLPAFLPVSQLATEHYPRVSDGDREKILEALRKLVGGELQVKIIDVNPRNNKLIISEKEIVSESIKATLDKYKADDVVAGIISGVANFGAFMKFADHPEIEGLIHISELDHRLIENPKEVVNVNDAVTAKITEIKDGRVSLSLKALKPNPWDTAGEKYQAGSAITGKVSRFNPFGAFIALDDDIQGLIHVSEFGGVEEMKNQIEAGKSYPFHIESVKPEEKRIILKLKKT